MKILLTSDNHLGYKENDKNRSEDSFTTFNEILEIAKTKEVDFLLQGGDLFHDNSPSKDTLGRTLNILNKNCVGNREIEFETNFPLNVHNENINICLPIISIHGNHDDPCGTSKNSIIEVLESTNFINYFGKHQTCEFLDITPILFHKENVKIAIYCVGNVRDKRIYRIFKDKKINFNRPAEGSYFNILLLHQNRIPYSGEDFVPIECIENWFDLVIFGHEHEPIMYNVDSKGFMVIQCGSTVRTSLSESEKGDKYCYFLEIKDDLHVEKIKLKTVRPFIFDYVKLDPKKPIEKFLSDKVEKMIDGVEMPLVRLKVEHNGELINKSKFGLIFKGRVANHNEILSFKKQRKTINMENSIDGELQRIPNNNDFLNGLFKDCELQAIPEALFIDGVQKFIDNGNKGVFNDMISNVISNAVSKLHNKIHTPGDSLSNKIKSLKEETNKKYGYKKGN